MFDSDPGVVQGVSSCREQRWDRHWLVCLACDFCPQLVGGANTQTTLNERHGARQTVTMELELREVSDPAAASAFGAVYLSVPLSEPEALFVAGRVAPGLHRVCLLDRTGQIASTTDLPGNHRVNDACRIPAADAVAIAVGEYDGGYLYEGGLLRWDLG